MIHKEGVLGVGLNVHERFITDAEVLAQKVQAYRDLDTGGKVVVTQGSYDLLHVGHMRYLHEAWQRGTFLVVLLDSDEKVRQRKGESRPVTNEQERGEMLCHLRWVNIVFLKPANAKQHEFVRLIKPDVLVVSESTGDRKYTSEKIAELQALCNGTDSVVVLPPQAPDSTTAKVRRFILEGAENFAKVLTQRFETWFPAAVKDVMGEIGGRGQE